MENLDLSELENIKNMLQSSDQETIKLALALCADIPEVQEHLYDYFYFADMPCDIHGVPVIYQLEKIKREGLFPSFMEPIWSYMFVYYHIITNILKNGKHIIYIKNEKENSVLL